MSLTATQTQTTQTAQGTHQTLSAAEAIAPPSQQHPVKHHQVVIVGGGAAGITVAAQLLKRDRTLDIAIVGTV